MEGFTVSRPLSGACRYDLVAELNGRFIKIQVKSLKLDSAYDQEKLPYKVFVLEAYSYDPVKKTKKKYSREEVDLIVGYNHDLKAFACVPLESFEGKYTAVVHETIGTRHEYFNNWSGLYEVYEELL